MDKKQVLEILQSSNQSIGLIKDTARLLEINERYTFDKFVQDINVDISRNCQVISASILEADVYFKSFDLIEDYVHDSTKWEGEHWSVYKYLKHIHDNICDMLDLLRSQLHIHANKFISNQDIINFLVFTFDRHFKEHHSRVFFYIVNEWYEEMSMVFAFKPNQS